VSSAVSNGIVNFLPVLVPVCTSCPLGCDLLSDDDQFGSITGQFSADCPLCQFTTGMPALHA